MNAPRSVPRRGGEFLAGGLSGLIALNLLWPVAFRGWIPADEGALGLAAVRVLGGGWPHFDFYDVYSGLQAIVHAGAFAILGVSIRSTRIIWLGVAVIAAVSLYAVLRYRLSRAYAVFASAGLVVLAFAMYPASMPTWWNLSLALVSVYAAYSGWVRNSAVVVAVAGFITGVSVLVKTTGGALIAIAIFLWLVSTCYGRRQFVASVVSVAALATIVALVAPVLSLARAVFLAVPAAAAVLLLWHRAGRVQVDPSTFRLPWFYTGGVLVPPLLFMATYAIAGRFGALVQGWFIAPAGRLESVTEDISVAWILPVAVALSLLFLVTRTAISPTVVRAVVAVAIIVLAWLNWAVVGGVLFGFLVLLPLILAGGAFGSRESATSNQLGALGTVAALMFILVSIPWWGPYYVAYAIPLLGLSLLLLISSRHHGFAIAVICLLAGVFLVRSLGGYTVGPVAVNDPIAYVDLENPRAGIAVPSSYAYYDDLARDVAELAAGSAVYAGPDAPEVPFLAGVASVVPALYEVLDSRWDYRVVADLAREGSVVVVNLAPNPSQPIPTEIRRMVLEHNQNHEKIGNFLVTWSSDP